MTTVIFCRVQL